MKKLLIILLLSLSQFGLAQTNCALTNLIDELKTNDQLKTALKETPDLSDAWRKLDDLDADDALKNDIDFLKNVKDWDGGGAKLTKNANGNLDLVDASGSKIAEVKNGNVLPERYGDGTPIGEPKNGYQLVDDGGELKMKRTPDTSGYDADELAKLTDHPNAHTLERHGHDVTDDALIKRANEGIAPDGTTIGSSGPPYPKPAYSSKFDSPEKLKDALDQTTRYHIIK